MLVSFSVYFLAANKNVLAAGEFSWSFGQVFSALSAFPSRSSPPQFAADSTPVRSDHAPRLLDREGGMVAAAIDWARTRR